MCTVPAGSPLNITVVVTSSFKADLSWIPPLTDQQNGVITKYIINITDDDTREELPQVSTTYPSLTLNNLQPYTTYTCIIAAQTSAGPGPFSSTISFTTDEYGNQLKYDIITACVICTPTQNDYILLIKTL